MARWWPWRSSLREAGEPGSANGASSFHLTWLLDGAEPLVEVAAVLEVLVPPAVDRLYFWALQVSFLDGDVDRGAAHVGLQWNRNHPGNRAVNWGGYSTGGELLAGTASSLPSRPDDPNTRDYPWGGDRAYRLRVHRAPGPPGRWRASVTDLQTGHETVIRDLALGGDRLASAVVWTEVFARCEHPSVAARWSGLEATTSGGRVVVPHGLRVSYEAHASGGCDNTSVRTDERGALQITATERLVPHGSVVGLHD
jgi:hypothetical protein